MLNAGQYLGYPSAYVSRVIYNSVSAFKYILCFQDIEKDFWRYLEYGKERTLFDWHQAYETKRNDVKQNETKSKRNQIETKRNEMSVV